MRRNFRIAAFLLLATGLCFGEVAKTGRKPAKKTASPPIPVQLEPAPPPRPLTPEEMPATPPNVGMSNGLLTITAENSTLGDVLNAVRRATGAAVDVPPSAGSERVAVHLGPGQPREVLGKLLSGSKFDYIIVGSPQNNAGVQRVILTARSGGPAGQGNPQPNVAANNPPHGYQPPPEDSYQPPDDVNANMDEEDPGHPEPSPEIPETVTMPVQPQPGAPVQPQGQQQPGQQQPGQVGQPGQPQNQNQNQPGPRTPEQLLQELQRLQQQQQQQQGNQPQPQDE